MKRILLLTALLVAALPAQGQMFSYRSGKPSWPAQAISFQTHLIDFKYGGEAAGPVGAFEFSGPAYGVAYQSRNLEIGIAYGSDNPGDSSRTRKLVDLNFLTWGEFRLTGRPEKSSLFIPVALYSHYRRVSREGDNVATQELGNAFVVTVIGIGAGLGGRVDAGKVLLEARSTPVIGFATRSSGDASGSSFLVLNTVRMRTKPVVGRVGLLAGYDYRLQHWNMDSTARPRGVPEDLFDYDGSSHSFSLGLTW